MNDEWAAAARAGTASAFALSGLVLVLSRLQPEGV
jgi:hypothetical protein